MSYLLIEGNFALMGGENNPFHSSGLHYLFAQQPHHKRPKRDWFRPLLPACRPLASIHRCNSGWGLGALANR